MREFYIKKGHYFIIFSKMRKCVQAGRAAGRGEISFSPAGPGWAV